MLYKLDSYMSIIIFTHFLFKNVLQKIMSHNDVMAKSTRILIWRSPGPETRQPFGVRGLMTAGS